MPEEDAKKDAPGAITDILKTVAPHLRQYPVLLAMLALAAFAAIAIIAAGHFDGSIVDNIFFWLGLFVLIGFVATIAIQQYIKSRNAAPVSEDVRLDDFTRRMLASVREAAADEDFAEAARTIVRDAGVTGDVDDLSAACGETAGAEVLQTAKRAVAAVFAHASAYRHRVYVDEDAGTELFTPPKNLIERRDLPAGCADKAALACAMLKALKLDARLNLLEFTNQPAQHVFCSVRLPAIAGKEKWVYLDPSALTFDIEDYKSSLRIWRKELENQGLAPLGQARALTC